MKEKIISILKYIFVNLLIIILVLFILNWVVYRFLYFSTEETDNNSNNYKEIPFSLKKDICDFECVKEVFKTRPFVGENYNKNGIIIFGCSFAYGHLLEEKDTFHYKLSQMLKRPVYSFASPGQAPNFALLRIINHQFDDIIKKSDYAIYVSIGEHVWRVHSHCNGFYRDWTYPKFDKKDGKLVLHKYRFPAIEASYLYKYINKRFFLYLTSLKSDFIQDYMFDFIKLHYETIRDELQKINPNIKMIILVYEDNADTQLFTLSKRWKELEDEGFIVVRTAQYLPEIIDQEYRIPNDGHPNALAWDKITDLMVNKLKLFDNN